MANKRELKRKAKVRETVSRNKRIHLSHGTATELKKGHKYLIAVDDSMMGLNDMQSLSNALGRTGVIAIVASFKGNPEDGLKVIEQKDDNSHTAEPTVRQPDGLVGAGDTPALAPTN